MSLDLHDTIAALASPPGPGARGIIRISGTDLPAVIHSLFRPTDHESRLSRNAPHDYPGSLRLPDSHQRLSGHLYWWPTTRSYTGQPMGEFHTIGSPPLLEGAMSDLFSQGVRPAHRGEFTLRAFLAGRVDLVQAEAVLGVIDAEDHVELEKALRQLAGGISGRIAEIRNELIDLLADLEAGLDFVEEDIEFVSRQELLDRLNATLDSLDNLLQQADDRMLSTGSQKVVLAGLPNAGKSTLFNALVGESTALVSSREGTTRDYLKAELNWHQTPIELIDTAGWGFQTDEIERSADTFRYEQLQGADLVVWCRAADIEPELREEDARLVESLRNDLQRIVTVRTKCDLNSDGHHLTEMNLSARKNIGLDELTKTATEILTGQHQSKGELIGTTAARCRESLTSAANSLKSARDNAIADSGDEIVAVDLRDVLNHLGHILGAVYTDDILDRIFSRFCIGK